MVKKVFSQKNMREMAYSYNLHVSKEVMDMCNKKEEYFKYALFEALEERDKRDTCTILPRHLVEGLKKRGLKIIIEQ